MALVPLALPAAAVALDPAWLEPPAADALLAALLDDVEWEVHRIRLFGRAVDSPRRSCWIGDPHASYAYSGTRFTPHEWPGAMLPVRARLQDELGIDFNSVLANLYRDGRDRMGWHRDNERELGSRPVIASLSLGARRRFVFRRRDEPARKHAIVLGHGSLLLMAGDTQAAYQHALPATAKPVGPRINLTFRRIGPEARG
ncbi:alpha-ketoglutarate-dependent dioxygenase AlkB family protein [Cognatiluteimonas telluris]|jgi:alkylated DNA repair dioxygenase AlkB|uniref:alpha-ketoglutarate-dependent dioxygenase AlkB family protein n=1 Tax=Cognatiluteimonas telluris TaxID=1104775 RepID=UPI00140894B0|nr:alpha-ketoglutarate-dependent dioxygenase AlkB [Lysobacter telluris]